MSVKKEIPDIFKGFVFPRHLFRDPALCVLGIVLILGQIFCHVLPKGKGGILGLAQCIPGSTEPLKEKARPWKHCDILLWGCCHVFLSSWISGLIVFVSVNLILCLRFIPAGVYPIEKGFVWLCCQFFLLVCKAIPRTWKGWSSPKYSKWQFADRRDLKMEIEVGCCWEILTLRATVHVSSSKLLTEETLRM